MTRQQPVFISSPRYAQTGFSGLHPLAISRVAAVEEICRETGSLSAEQFEESVPAPVATLTRFHDPAYVAALQEADALGTVPSDMRKKFNFGTMENPMFPGLFHRAATTVDGSIRAATRALAGGIGYHPAGGTHHGQPGRANGFCYFNDPVFAILTLLDGGLQRIAYIDLDAHHGDGVETAFEDNPFVLTLSVHEENRWPYSGPLGADFERGIINIPVPENINDSEYQLVLREFILPCLADWQPEALVITCGADGLKGDPLSKMSLSNKMLWNAVEALLEQTPKAAILGGGGYNPWTTIRCWTGLWSVLNDKTAPAPLPRSVLDLLAGLESDLVDEDEIEPDWLEQLADPGNPGPVRQEIHDRLHILPGT